MRQAIVDYFKNPAANPSLGDATPILDQLDPFRDGKASQRIGEFVAWYLEKLDGDSNSDDAVRYATDKYAEKWGANKVLRRIWSGGQPKYYFNEGVLKYGSLFLVGSMDCGQ